MEAAQPGRGPPEGVPPVASAQSASINNNNTDDPLADNTRTCFICLQTPDEDPAAAWVAPCPCTLTAHQECLLLWIDGKEHGHGDGVEVVRRGELQDEEEEEEVVVDADGRHHAGPPRRLRPTRKVRCPACNAPIYTLEAPPDFWVHLGDTLANNYRYYLAPHILATMAATMAIAGSSYYGFSMFMSVAGPDRVIPWLAGGSRRFYQLRPYDVFGPPPPLSSSSSSSATARLLSHPADVLRTNARMALLGLVAPTLLLHRAMPFFTYSLGLPLSWAWSVSLAVQRYRATRSLTRSLAVPWPPPASVCMAALPSISMAYALAYHWVVGGFERRLDQALGHALEAYVGQGQEDQQGQDNQNDNDDNDNDVPADANDGGFFGFARRLRGAAANAVRDNNNGINNGGGGGGILDVFNDNEQFEFQIEVVVEEHDGGMIPDVQVDGVFERGDAAVPPDIQRPAAPPPAAPVVPAARPPPQPPNNNQVQLMPERYSARSIIAASTTQLLLPSIASTIGDVLWMVLPASLTTAATSRWQGPGSGSTPTPTRFLSQRWARSLVGGALFVVLRDLFKLYGKYRRVQTRGQRMVKNYDRGRRRGGS